VGPKRFKFVVLLKVFKTGRCSGTDGMWILTCPYGAPRPATKV